MESALHIYNTLSRNKEKFEAINPPHVGLYVCGPTVYSYAHLGNVRTALTFDVVYRYLTFLGYKVRYVRNITDVGHLESDADTGEDKIAKRARLEQLEPMEIVQRYTNYYHEVLSWFNLIQPSIEPTATGHLFDQIEMVQKIIDNGYAYESNGSVYFDVKKYEEKYQYGILSGRKTDELLENTRELEGQSEKRYFADFAIWKAVGEEHIMKWKSPWGIGVPGWHLECSAMSTKYLGCEFDIHGGGLDLVFPHHECEIAQSVGADGVNPVKYWMHSNMLTVNGTKMSKSLGNSFYPHELISGNHDLLEKAYSPMVVRFFMLQTHYSSTLDFSNEAIQASEKGYSRLMEAYTSLSTLTASEMDEAGPLLNEALGQLKKAMDDDFHTPKAIASLFELASIVQKIKNKQLQISQESLIHLQVSFKIWIEEIMGLKPEVNVNNDVLDGLMDLILKIRQSSRANKDWTTSDTIRDALTQLKIQVKDGKEGAEWSFTD